MASTITDFVVRQGIIVQGTVAVTSSTGQVAALQVNSGAAIKKNLIVGTTATIWGPLTVKDSSTLAGLSASGIVTFTNSTNATSTSTGAVQVAGGASIAQDLWVGGIIYGTVVGTITTATNLAGGTAGQVPYQTAPGVTSFYGPGNAGQLLVSAGASAPVYTNTSSIYVQDANVSTNVRGGSTGQLVYQSGANTSGFVGPGSAGQVLVSTGASAPVYQNTLTLAGTTAATSTSTGALVVAGGVGVGGDLYVAGEIVAQKLTIQYTTITTTLVTTDDIIKTTNTTDATSTTTGALQIAGGAGIGGNVYVGGSLNVAGGLNGTITTATNLAGGALGFIPYQTEPGVTNFIGTGTIGSILQMGANTATFVTTSSVYVNSAVNAETLRGGTAGQLVFQSSAGVTSFAGPGTSGQLLVSAGTGTPTYTNTSSIYVGAATSSVNLFGGVAGSLPYQSADGATTFLSIGSTGYVLTSTGTGPAWSPLGGLTAGNATTATNIAGGTAGQVPYQTAPGVTSFYGPGTTGQVLVSNGTGAPAYQSTLTLAGTASVNSTDTGAFQVVGGVGIGGGIFVGGATTSTGAVTVKDSTAATSTTTGALVVAGGVGIGGTLHVGPVTSGSVVPALYSNNTLLATYTSPVLTQDVSADLDTFAVSAYSSAKYFVQVKEDGGTGIHITEVSLFHNGTNVYLNEYGTAYSAGSLAIFDASISGGNVVFQVTPNVAAVVKVVRMSLTA